MTATLIAHLAINFQKGQENTSSKDEIIAFQNSELKCLIRHTRRSMRLLLVLVFPKVTCHSHGLLIVKFASLQLLYYLLHRYHRKQVLQEARTHTVISNVPNISFFFLISFF